MAKELKNVTLFIESKEGKKPTGAFITFDIELDKAKKTKNIFHYENPDFSLSSEKFWLLGITAIKKEQEIK